MKGKVFLVIIPAAAVALFALNRFENARTVGRVNGTALPRSRYEQKIAEKEAFYRYSGQTPAPTAIAGAALDGMVTSSLVEDYAAKNSITVSSVDIEARYARVVAGYNRNHSIAGAGDSAFLAALQKMYGIGREEYLKEIRLDILKETIQAREGMSFAKWLEKARQAASVTINR